MLSYSPYDNVKKQDYPAMLVTTGLWDSQVQYFEPAKWVAKLRAHKTDESPLLFHIEMEAGHAGLSGRFRGYLDYAREYAFLLSVLPGARAVDLEGGHFLPVECPEALAGALVAFFSADVSGG